MTWLTAPYLSRARLQEYTWQPVQSLANCIDGSGGDQRLEQGVPFRSELLDAGYVPQEPLPQRVQDQAFDIAGPAVRREEGVEAPAPVVERAEALFEGHPPGVQGHPRGRREG